jgi:hypothetical protein
VQEPRSPSLRDFVISRATRRAINQLNRIGYTVNLNPREATA